MKNMLSYLIFISIISKNIKENTSFVHEQFFLRDFIVEGIKVLKYQDLFNIPFKLKDFFNSQT